jgi:ABC-type phosphate transport system substrate-binding protein
MRRACAISFCLVCAIIWLAPVSGSRAVSEQFKVIVHPSNPVTSVERQFLRDAYLKYVTSWKHGEALRPIDLTRRFPARESFTEHVLQKSVAQLRNYWVQAIFSGKGVPPPETDTTATVIAYVLAQPGAVAYLPADVNPGGAKVVRLLE